MFNPAEGDISAGNLNLGNDLNYDTMGEVISLN